MKYIQDTKAAKSLSAMIVMKGTKIVGKILAYHSDGSCWVQVWNWGKTLDDTKDFEVQNGRASGYG